ncbi:MAG TPA: hypothetical protein PLQ54_19555, partial [Armatimonadota bacterium]|nr:hypothetical protein [Armatimonadota bacterium]
MLVARWIICLLTVGVLEAAACPAAPQPAAPQPSMPAQEALATLAEFLHIDVADITLVREGQTGRSEAAFGGLVRHKPPTDGPWWGPPDAAGLVECRLEVGRERGTGKPYVVLADWAIVGRSFGTPAISLEAVPDLARAFLEAYCPYLDDSVKMTYFKGFPDGESDVGMTGWTRETATTSLWIQADVRLDDGSISYGCRYRTGLTPAAITEDQARQIAEEQWRAKYPEQELVYEKTSKLLES